MLLLSGQKYFLYQNLLMKFETLILQPSNIYRLQFINWKSSKVMAKI